MDSLPNCQKCTSTLTYQDRNLYICPECAHEWTEEMKPSEEEVIKLFKDAHGNELKDGDTISVLKDLKVKGTSLVVKVGTKVKGIRLIDGDHNIDCKIKGIGAMQLKSEFVKKVSEK